MKFSDIFEEILSEGKKFSEEKFDRFMENAGWWLFDQFQNTPSDIRTIPGYGDYVAFAKSRSKEKLDNWDNFVYTLPDYYGDWINLMDDKKSNKIMSDTILRFGLQDKMSGRDNYVPKKRGRKPKAQSVEPQDDAMAHFDQAVEKKRRGRPSLPDELKKKYVPTGLPRGRRPKVRDAEAEPEFTLEPTDEPVIKQRGGARTGAGRPRKPVEEPMQRPVEKMRGRPSKESKYEPEMQPSRIKTLEDRIASLEALLREKGILAEQRTLLESRLQMMKDYRKFL